LERRTEELCGEPAVLFALMEAGREALTALNKPEGECAICLGDIDEAEEELILRLPCYHVFHRRCVIEYCQRELGRHSERPSILCPECRADIPWTGYSEMQDAVVQTVQELPAQTPSCDQLDEGPGTPELCSGDCKANGNHDRPARLQPKKALPAAESMPSRAEAFIRLHHLYQGNDEKEKPLLRLLKELGLDAVVYYGKPALLHIQGDASDVDSFAGTAKRRHITVTIDVAQRSNGPPIAGGVTSVAAVKGSLDSSVLKKHLEQRGFGETSFTIVGR
jgi:hypothetical protein